MAHAGLDTAVYPGRAILADLYARTNLAWIAVYAQAPSHHDDSFRGKVAEIRAIGLGTMPVFVGQEQDGRGSRILDAAQGYVDAKAFAAWMREEGYVAGSKGALDHEGVDPLIPGDRDYIGAFKQGFEAEGFVFVAYCGHLIVEQVLAAAPGALLWVVKVPPFDPVNGDELAGTTFPNGDPAALSGVPGAIICQCREEARLTDFGGLHVDCDTATELDPSAP